MTDNLPAIQVIEGRVPGCDFSVRIEGDRVVRTDTDQVAVLYSPGFGAGWTTWNRGVLTPFEPAVVLAVLSDQRGMLTFDAMTEWLGLDDEADIYCGGASDLTVRWLDRGTPFEIREYDGSESIVLLNGPPPYVA